MGWGFVSFSWFKNSVCSGKARTCQRKRQQGTELSFRLSSSRSIRTDSLGANAGYISRLLFTQLLTATPKYERRRRHKVSDELSLNSSDSTDKMERRYCSPQVSTEKSCNTDKGGWDMEMENGPPNGSKRDGLLELLVALDEASRNIQI